ncbi:O-methyltransferase [Thiohalophilus sp.]|uniref:O-methyltransferase n=1 Tax=Thiohalophilus sp. TaxID=3028392 RepID=UPI002ACDA6AD|nr:O-methyltransferase [Thiohalophilus sp.]MDZ7661648.1 O-methyltransferase [Thiohalophilus sp.]
MSSSEKVHFVLRTNKNIERKLIVECLRTMQPHFDFSKYRYIGMGSFWFADFLLFHKSFSIVAMDSIETAALAERASFNKPLACIEVHSGFTTNILPTIELAREPCIIWLDYDSDLTGPVLEDVRISAGELKPGSVFIITLNAHIGQLGPSSMENSNEGKVDVLSRLAPDLVPSDINPEVLTQKGFQKILGKIVFAHLAHCVKKADPSKDFMPMFNFAYKDDTPMVTVGGMIVDEQRKLAFDKCNLSASCEYATVETQYRINVPPLTMKEKFAIDQLLPSVGGPKEEEVKRRYGFSIKQSQLRDYQRFYRFYPLFGEMQN